MRFVSKLHVSKAATSFASLTFPVEDSFCSWVTCGLRHGKTKLSAPFGFASYATEGALRKIEYRLLPSSGAAR
jgi:hypothetical protein